MNIFSLILENRARKEEAEFLSKNYDFIEEAETRIHYMKLRKRELLKKSFVAKMLEKNNF